MMELSENANQADKEKAAQSSGEAMAEDEIAEEQEEGEEEGQEGQESTEGTQPGPAPAQTATTRQALPRKRSARDDEPYEWEQCTVVLTIQLLPVRTGETREQRRVIVAAQTHSDPPVYKILPLAELGALPQPAAEVLAQLKAALPTQRERRKKLEAERAQAAQAQKAAASKTGNKRKEQAKPEASAKGDPKPDNGAKAATASKASKKKKLDLNALPELPGFEMATTKPAEQTGAVQS